jgi:hypothetical protein
MYAEQVGSLFNDWRGSAREGPNCKYQPDDDRKGYIHPHEHNSVAGAVFSRLWLVTTCAIVWGSELLSTYGRMFRRTSDGKGVWEHHEVCVRACVLVCVFWCVCGHVPSGSGLVIVL